MVEFYNQVAKHAIMMLLLILYMGVGHAQEKESDNKEEFFKNKLSIYTGYSWVPEGKNPNTDEKGSLLAPTLGFSYEYWFTEKWALGTYNDIQIVNVQVEKDNGEFLERENAVALTLGATYEVIPRLTISLGGGIESDANETLGIVRFGSEYVLIEKNEWELSASFTFIHKDVYEILGFGFVFGRKF